MLTKRMEGSEVSNSPVMGFSTDARRWQALLERCSAADGVFLYAVKTTGIYCRPGCSSRLPKAENVTFFDTWIEAEKAGFRACKRCQPKSVRPEQQQADAIAQICKLIEQSEEPITLEAMAQAAGLSPYHFHRRFKQIIGITPSAYVKAHRAQRLRHQLQEKSSVTQAIHEAGFQSSSSFYGISTALLGMTPTEYRRGASQLRIRFTAKLSWLGWVLVATTDRGICAIFLGDSPEELMAQLQQQFPRADIQADTSFEHWVDQVIDFIGAPQGSLELPLDIQGTAFQQRVWQALKSIPPGCTATYSDIASQLGSPKSARAVARACATNAIAVAIPCHRVVGRDGSLRGYRWGQSRKRALLHYEASQAAPVENASCQT